MTPAGDRGDPPPPVGGGRRATLGLYGAMLAVFAMTALSGALDPLLGPLVRAAFGPISDTAVRDVRMMGVLLLFACSFVGMILGVLEKGRDRLLLVIGVAGVYSGSLAFMLKRMGDGLDGKPLYVALTVLLALVLPVALVGARPGATRLVHVYATFAVALLIGMIGGGAVLGLSSLLWPTTALAENAGTHRFVVTPMAVVMVGTGWGAMACYPALIAPAGVTVHRAWAGVYVLVAVVLASGYGWLFLSSKSWLSAAESEHWTASAAAMALLLPSVIVTVLLVRDRARPPRRELLLVASVLGAITHALAALQVSRLLATGADGGFPFAADLDRWPFVLSHAAAGATGVLLLIAVRRTMEGYPWPRWHWMSKVLK